MISFSSSYKRNVPILALCQALFMSGTSLIVATTALVGFELAEDKSLASLPFSLQLIATMLTSIPAALLMEKIGRKRAFLSGTVLAFIGAIICTFAIIQHHFLLFISGCILIGVFSGFANYYRFTAADNVDEQHKSRAISYVLAGGVLAAIIGPNLANHTRDLISDASFAGSYAAIISLYVLSFILISLLNLPHKHVKNTGVTKNSSRPLKLIIQQPRFIIAVICGTLGYAVMSLVMTATPLAMHHHEHIYSDTAFVIQWHVLGMFVPSFFTGNLILRFGLLKIMLIGACCALLCVIINLSGTTVWHFWLALLLLGVSWNFLFIGATTLLTETYQPDERFKTQAINDFIVFSIVASASLSAGLLQHNVGWKFVNYGAIPAIFIIYLCLFWLYRINKITPPSVIEKTPVVIAEP